MKHTLEEALAILGYREIRTAQKYCLKSILDGKNTFCVLATGGGKTALAIIPTLMFDYKTIIFSPLIALMKDQADSLNKKNIKTAIINSNQSDTENSVALSDWMTGACNILYITPERISLDIFKTFINKYPPDLVVIDEAHTMSQWSVSFRPSYMKCGTFIKECKPKQVIALTATATKEIIDDVKNIINIPDMVLERHYEERSNLILSSSIVNDADLFYSVLQKCREVTGSVIIYCSTVNLVTSLAKYLIDAGESVTFYHGQIRNQATKDINQDTFMSGRARIMVATNAFGMGIDKPDIEAVIHATPPNSVEAIAQEIGRAARDGRQAFCHMFGSNNGFSIQEFFWDMSYPSANTVKELFNYIKNNRNADGVLEKTVRQIEDELCCKNLAAAFNCLISNGCIERSKSNDTVATVIVNNKTGASDHYKKILDAIIKYGACVDLDKKVYKIDIELLAETFEVTKQTVIRYLKLLNTDLYITYIPPFSGKCTKIIRELSDIDLVNIALRRASEKEKMDNVIGYIECPDSKKHEYLNKYFSIK